MMLLVLLVLQTCLSAQALLFGDKKPTHGILPKSQAKGIDICGVDVYSYIIRSDLGCYMRSTNFHKGENLAIFSLHNSVRGGDHYLAHKDDLFYVIKGDSYRRVTNLNSDENAVVYNLHPNCRNGDHYYSSEDSFYIVFKKRGMYRRVTDMSKDSHAREFHIHPDLKDGLYYWGNKDFVFILKTHDKWGIQFHQTSSLNTNADRATRSFDGDVASFLPGGLVINYGPAFGVWEVLKTIHNKRSTNATYEREVVKSIGYDKKKMSRIERRWSISESVEVSYGGGLVPALVQAQLSLEYQFGGLNVDTEDQTWTQLTTVKEKITIDLPPNSKMYFWQFQLGLGKEEVLFTRDLAFTDSATPPAHNPLPSLNESE